MKKKFKGSVDKSKQKNKAPVEKAIYIIDAKQILSQAGIFRSGEMTNAEILENLKKVTGKTYKGVDREMRGRGLSK